MSDSTKTKSPARERNAVRKLTSTAVLAAVSTVLMFLSFNVPFMPGFIKMDFSELPALLASFTIGPASGVAVCLIKNLINLFTTTTGGIGELCNFLLGAAFAGTAGAMYKYIKRPNKSRGFAALCGAVGAVASGAASLVTNYYVVYPVYMDKFMPLETILAAYQTFLPWIENLWQALAIFNLPFTVLKCLASVLICFFICKPLKPILAGRSA